MNRPLHSPFSVSAVSGPAQTHWRHLIFLGFLLFCIFIFRASLFQVARSCLTVDQYAPFILVLPLSITLVVLERRRIVAAATFCPPGAFAFALLIAAFVFLVKPAHGFDQSEMVSLSVLFFVLSCVAAFVVCYGMKSFRAAAAPWLFLVLITPLPDAVVARTITFLQNGSADATVLLFKLANIPVARNGVVLRLPKLDIEIARECSGIRSSLVLLISSLVLAHLFLKSLWTKGALALAVIPISIAKNGLRIFTLSTLGMYVDPSFLTGQLHRNGGILFFALALGCIWFLMRGLLRLEGPALGPPSKPVLTGAPTAAVR